MKKVSRLLFLLVMVLSISGSAAYANTDKKEENAEKDLWISDYATDENSSKGTVTENVDKNGNAIDVEKEEFIDVRQFVTFKTKNGKTLHLIIDHSKNNQNVKLLTEVSELDLLNMLDEGERKKLLGDKKEEIKKEEPKKVEELKPEQEKVEKKEDKKSSNSLYLIFGIFILIFIGAGYYFKVYKKKSDDFEDDEEDYDELKEDYEVEEKTQEDIQTYNEDIDTDEMAIANFDEEDEE